MLQIWYMNNRVNVMYNKNVDFKNFVYIFIFIVL